MAKFSESDSRPLRILFMGAEADPYIKVGGLGDVTGSLPRALRSLPGDVTGNRRLDVRLAIPFHPAIRPKVNNPMLVEQFQVQRSTGPVAAKLFFIDSDGVPLYLIDGDPIASNESVYSMDTAADGERYTFFSLATLEAIKRIGWQPDIIHAHDWHTAMAVYWICLHRKDEPFYSQTQTIITVHNLPFMGGGSGQSLLAYGLPPTQDAVLPAWARDFPLPLALLTANQITTVSPTYAREMLTEEFGSGLQNFLVNRTDEITGILNGLDQSNWDPSKDQTLTAPFTLRTLEERQANKRALLAEAGFQVSSDIPLLVFIGRMDPQKGIDLAIDALKNMMDLPWQAIFLGTGVPHLEKATYEFERQYPDRVKAKIRFDAGLARRMYAGGDMILMPSRYEPCGLAQMIAMRYGCLPVARAVGGLKDSIQDLPAADGNTGFLFTEAASNDLEKALRRALSCYEDHDTWVGMQTSAMKQDFSWSRSAKEYSNLYHQLMKKSFTE